MVQIQNLNKIINFLRKSLRNRKINSTFALANGKLGYGVMVTLQILVLSFQVRILVAQLKQNEARRCRKAASFCFWVVWRKFYLQT